ncbi:dipeptide ABC transporter ATP-binding protein [Azospirillum sp. 412522]|nr:dipeptide ABC transporter ATP-binding protein [Azospirillum sp. 412522]MBY6262645.1 dipeptide ABC transporter ATP-binding protein [Azospirillum sp. 412522]
MTAPLLEIRDLKKDFPVRGGLLGRSVRAVKAVDGVGFTLRRGETLGLVGESGCGKSTVGKLILRLMEPTGGTIRLDGRDMTAARGAVLRDFRRQVQMVFQDPYASLNPRMRAGAIVAETIQNYETLPRAVLRERVAALLGKVGLRPDAMEKFPFEFSGGQRQRLGIARALALSPSVIVADEPVSALDVSVQAQVINLLMDLQRDLGVAYLFISHDLGVVEHIAHRVAVMYLGRIVEIGETAAIFSAPRHPYTQALISAAPVSDPRLRRLRLYLEGDVPSPLDPPQGCAFHTRCPFAFDRCRREVPVLGPRATGQAAACHLPDPQAVAA